MRLDYYLMPVLSTEHPHLTPAPSLWMAVDEFSLPLTRALSLSLTPTPISTQTLALALTPTLTLHEHEHEH